MRFRLRVSLQHVLQDARVSHLRKTKVKCAIGIELAFLIFFDGDNYRRIELRVDRSFSRCVNKP